MGLTETGLSIKRLPNLISSLNSKASTLFQDLVPPGDSVDTTPGTVLGRLIGIQAEPLSELWEQLQEVYSAFDPNAAIGVALDNLAALGGLNRFSAAASQSYVFLGGTFGTTIPVNSMIKSTSTGVSFGTDEPITLDGVGTSAATITVTAVNPEKTYSLSISDSMRSVVITYTTASSPTLESILNGLMTEIFSNATSMVDVGTVDGRYLTVTAKNIFDPFTLALDEGLAISQCTKSVLCTALVTGPIEQPPNTITEISTPVFGWLSATNYTSASVGRNKETDEELRLRFRNSKFMRGGNISDALLSDILDISGVNGALVLVNPDSATDSNGLPPHSFMAVVDGGRSEEIAAAIWRNRPTGISSHGSSSAFIIDSAGNDKEVFFQRPTPVPFYVSIDLSTTSIFPSNGAELIKSALVAFSAEQFTIGTDIIYSRLYSPINSVSGHQVNSLKIGREPNPGGITNILIEEFEKPILDAARVSISFS